MEMYVNEMCSIEMLGNIRVNSKAKIKSSKVQLNGKTTIYSNIEIEPYNILWNHVVVELTLGSAKNEIDLDSAFCIYLTNSLNSDRLIIANNNTQKYFNSNIFEIVWYMVNEIWIPVAKGELTISEQEWENLIPDVFKLIPESDFNKVNFHTLEQKFDKVTNDKDLSGFLHAEFFTGTQPIMVFYSDFYDFCKRYEIL